MKRQSVLRLQMHPLVLIFTSIYVFAVYSFMKRVDEEVPLSWIENIRKVCEGRLHSAEISPMT